MQEEGRGLASEGFDVVVGAAFLYSGAVNDKLLDGLERCPPSPDGKGLGAILDVQAKKRPVPPGRCHRTSARP